jgi:hypothetical protein
VLERGLERREAKAPRVEHEPAHRRAEAAAQCRIGNDGLCDADSGDVVLTHDARQLARDNRIQLLDRKALLGLVIQRTPEPQAKLLVVAPRANCGSRLVRAVASR